MTLGDRDRKLAIMVSPGSIIKIVDGAVKPNGLVLIERDGKNCEMFLQDLEERGELVASARVPF